MATIYLSSTYEDLKDYRRVVFEALRKAGHQVIAMEEYVATDQRPLKECLKGVEKADIYVGLFAFRYGYIPPADHENAEGLSITELELRHAERLQKSPLTFIAHEDAGLSLNFVDAHTGDGESGKQIKRLREYVRREYTASFFSGTYQLASLVQAAVTKKISEMQTQSSSAVSQANAQMTVTWDIEEKGSPYPGLFHFTRKYAPVFFGRDVEIREILDRMGNSEGRFIIVSGDSGSGKSSVIDAGVLPHIEKGSLPDSQQALCVRMLPSQGRHPFGALMGALNPFATQAGLKPDDIGEDLNRSPEKLAGHIRVILERGTDRDALVLFLDQMEELFTAYTANQSRQFLHALSEAAQEGPLWVLATIRSDHLHHCHDHPEMLRVLRGPGHYPLGPIEPYILPDLIRKPAWCAGLSISDNLVSRIVHETMSRGGESPGLGQSYLPLLGFVLNHLFEKMADHELSERKYEEVGGVVGAIAHHAGQVEAELHRTRGGKPAELLGKLFESLVIVNMEGLPTRRRPLLAEFHSEMRKVIEILVQTRLLRTEGEGMSATVSIGHEKLFEAWPSLKTYVDTNKKQLVDRALLDSRAKKWVDMGKPWFSGLASGREYRDFCRARVTPTTEMKEYLSASRRAHWLFNGAITLVVLLVAGTTWLWQKGYNLEQAGLKVKSLVVSIHVEPEMIPVEEGTFRQGDIHGLGDASEQPVRDVRIKPFAMGKYEVTFEEYDRFAIAAGSPLPSDQGWGRGRRPVINVSWDDAKAYAEWLSKATGKHYRLPKESEWEYAARSGGKDDEIWAGTSDQERLAEYAVYAANPGNRTAPVAQEKPNGLRIHDMSGNVFEWVEDCVHFDYTRAPEDGRAWLEEGGGDCTMRVIRGGSWGNIPGSLRASYRYRDHAVNRNFDIGFRLAQDI